MKKAEKMREKFCKMMFESDRLTNMVVVPDVLAARVAEQQGFKALFVAGYAASSDLL